VISLPEMVHYEILEKIFSCQYRQENVDIYVLPRIYEQLKRHPDARPSGSPPPFEEGDYSLSVTIQGRYFMVYPDCPNDVEWYVYCEEDSPSVTVTTTAMRAKITCL